MSALKLIGDRLEFQIIRIQDALFQQNYDYILELADEQIKRGVHYLNLNVGSLEEDKAIMIRLVKELQSNFENVPLFLSSENASVIEAGLRVYNAEKDKAVVNSADAGKKVDFLNLAADYDAKVVCMCKKNEIPLTEKERIDYCSIMLESGMALGLNPNDMYFDPVVISILEEQERLPSVLKAIEQIDKLGLNTLIGLSNVSTGLSQDSKTFIESAFINMAMSRGLTAAILNPLNSMLMLNIFSGENVLNQRIFTQAVFTKAGYQIQSEENKLLEGQTECSLPSIEEEIPQLN